MLTVRATLVFDYLNDVRISRAIMTIDTAKFVCNFEQPAWLKGRTALA